MEGSTFCVKIKIKIEMVFFNRYFFVVIVLKALKLNSQHNISTEFMCEAITRGWLQLVYRTSLNWCKINQKFPLWFLGMV